MVNLFEVMFLFNVGSVSCRDIPMPLVTSGVEHGNLRELALARMKDLGTEVKTHKFILYFLNLPDLYLFLSVPNMIALVCKICSKSPGREMSSIQMY